MDDGAETVTCEMIRGELAKMAVVFERRMSPEELQRLAEIWAEACGDMEEWEFLNACGIHLRTGKEFPVPAHIRSLGIPKI